MTHTEILEKDKEYRETHKEELAAKRHTPEYRAMRRRYYAAAGKDKIKDAIRKYQKTAKGKAVQRKASAKYRAKKHL